MIATRKGFEGVAGAAIPSTASQGDGFRLIAKLSPACFRRGQGILLFADERQLPRFFRVIGDPMQLRLGQILFCNNRLDWTDGDAGPTIDADVIVDIHHFVVGMKTFDRANGDTFGEPA
jgi:hypothetical protein